MTSSRMGVALLSGALVLGLLADSSQGRALLQREQATLALGRQLAVLAASAGAWSHMPPCRQWQGQQDRGTGGSQHRVPAQLPPSSKGSDCHKHTALPPPPSVLPSLPLQPALVAAR